LQVFIFSFVSGTALSQLQALLDDPHRIVSLLGVSAPQQASFFSTYILLLVSYQDVWCVRLCGATDSVILTACSAVLGVSAPQQTSSFNA
jgi:hypothetical protein